MKSRKFAGTSAQGCIHNEIKSFKRIPLRQDAELIGEIPLPTRKTKEMVYEQW
jgi:hypothetical protein